MTQSRPKRIRCPICMQFLTLHRPSRYDDWHECTTENCLLFGMEGLSHHWATLGKIINPRNILVIKCKEELGVDV